MPTIDRFLERFFNVCDEYHLTDRETSALWERLKVQAMAALQWRQNHPSSSPEEAHAAIRALTLRELARVVVRTTHGIPIERKRNIVVFASHGSEKTTPLTTHFHDDSRVQIIGLSGAGSPYEVDQKLYAADGCVFYIQAKRGLDLEIENTWKLVDKHRRARLVCIANSTPAQFIGITERIQKTFGVNAVPLDLPLEMGSIDLLQMNAGRKEDPKQRELSTILEHWRGKLFDVLGVPLWKRGEDRIAELKAAIRARTIARDIVPVLCTRESILDAVVDYLPSPADVRPLAGWNPIDRHVRRITADDRGSFVGRVCDVVRDPYLGDLGLMRVYSGSIEKSRIICNCIRHSQGRVKLAHIEGATRSEIDEARAGDIVFVTGFHDLRTGDVFTDPEHPFIFGRNDLPELVVAAGIKPREPSDRDQLWFWLAKLMREDATFKAQTTASDDILLFGTGELQLKALLERLNSDFNSGFKLDQLFVLYKQTVARSGVGEAEQDGITVRVSVNPRKRPGTKVLKAWTAPDWYQDVWAGIQEALDEGLDRGRPFTNVRAKLDNDPADFYPWIDSVAGRFKNAAAIACRRALRKAEPVIVEPVMILEVFVATHLADLIIADLGRRRADLQRIEERADAKVIRATAPLKLLLGYPSHLEQISGGQATCLIQFHKYCPISE